MHSKELIQKTRDTFEPRYGKELTQIEVEEIINNMIAFAVLLIGFYQEEKQKERTE